MKKIIVSILFVVLGGVASLMAIPQAQTSKPFEQNDINPKRAHQPFEQNDVPEVGTKHIKQNEKIWNQEYREYQRKEVKQPIDVKTTNPKVKLKEGESYNVVGETKVATQTGNVTISQGSDAQYYHRYERGVCGTVKVEEYQKPLSMNQFAVNATDEESSDIIETGQMQNVGYDSNPNEGWNEQVKDGPIGDAIIPLLLLALLYIRIKLRG